MMRQVLLILNERPDAGERAYNKGNLTLLGDWTLAADSVLVF